MWLDCLSVETMGRLAACAPQGREETEVWRALLAGWKVCVPRSGLLYRQYRKSAPPEVYRRLVRLERELREMGVIVVRNCGGKPLVNQKGTPIGGTNLPVGLPDGHGGEPDLR